MKKSASPVMKRCHFRFLICIRLACRYPVWNSAGIRVMLIALPLFLSFATCLAEELMGAAASGVPFRCESTFGSRIILSTLWTAEELMGKPEDKQSIRQRYRSPPQHLIPGSIHAPLNPELQDSIRHVTPIGNKKVIALTFDLCESANEKSGYDTDIVNYLRENNIKATFFAGGKWMVSHPEKILQLMADPLFEIGNHSWSHANFRTVDSGRMQNQILWTQAQYETFWERLRERVIAAEIDPSEMNSIPKSIHLFRFPFGACNPQALDILRGYGLPAIQWDVVTGDPAPDRSPQSIAHVILRNSRPGSIVVCHANGRGQWTSRALPLFVPKLRETGYGFVTVSELLAQGAAVSSKECYELAPGDNLRYDGSAVGRNR